MILAGKSQDLKGRARRRMYPIHMYVGRNGSAKTCAAVWDSLPTLETGRPVLSTVRLLDYQNPRPCEGWEAQVIDTVQQPDGSYRPVIGQTRCTDEGHGFAHHTQAHPLWVPFRTWPQLLDWRFGDVIMDEVTGVADSNDNAGLPAPVRNFIAQMRRADVSVRITGISWMRAAKQLREVVVAVTRCKSSMPVRPRKNATLEDRVWRPRRLATWRTYDAMTLPIDDITEHAWEEAQKLTTARHWIPTSQAITAYDTYAPVLAVGTVTDAGTCAHCGGARRKPECSCHDYQERKALSPTRERVRIAKNRGELVPS